MAEQPRLEPKDLTQEELLSIVEQVRDILWPNGDRGHPWTPDTIDQVASRLQAYNLEP